MGCSYSLHNVKRHFIHWDNNMKNPDKNLSGKSDEREVKLCKIRFFTLHSSFFILRKHSFRTVKPKGWPRQRPCFIAWNMVFHTMKPYLWRTETLPFAIPSFVNRPFTIEYPCNYLSFSDLRKTSKIALFSSEWPFRDQHPPFFGVKIRIFLDIIHSIHTLLFSNDDASGIKMKD